MCFDHKIILIMKRNTLNSDSQTAFKQMKANLKTIFKDAVITESLKDKCLNISTILPAILLNYCFLHTLKLDFNPSSKIITAVWITLIGNGDYSVISANSEHLISCLKRFGSFCIDGRTGVLSFRTTAKLNPTVLNLSQSTGLSAFSKMASLHTDVANKALNFHLNKILYLMNYQTIEENRENVLKFGSSNSMSKMRTIAEATQNYPTRIQTQLFGGGYDPKTSVQNPDLVLPGNGKKFDDPDELVVKELKPPNSERSTFVLQEAQNTGTSVQLFGQGTLEKYILKYEILNGSSEKITKRRATLKKDSQCHRNLQYLLTKKNRSPTLAKHYLIKNELYLELYSHGTLDQFLLDVKHVSLLSKLWIFINIADGLRELLKQGLVHTDIEPATIFIENNYFPRIGSLEKCFAMESHKREINGGQEYKNYLQNFKRPSKIPYTPPELLVPITNSKQINQKTPVYMFGMLIINILFEMKPLPYKKEGFAMLFEKMKKGTARYTMSPQEAELHGPADAFKALRLLAYRCIDPNSSARPSIEDVIIVLRQTIRFLEQLYAY